MGEGWDVARVSGRKPGAVSAVRVGGRWVGFQERGWGGVDWFGVAEG